MIMLHELHQRNFTQGLIARQRTGNSRGRRKQTCLATLSYKTLAPTLTRVGGGEVHCRCGCGDVDTSSFCTARGGAERCATFGFTCRRAPLPSGTVFCCSASWERLSLLIALSLDADVWEEEAIGGGKPGVGEREEKRLMASILAIASRISIDHSSCTDDSRFNKYCNHHAIHVVPRQSAGE